MIKPHSLVWVDELGIARIESYDIGGPHCRVRLLLTQQSMLVPKGDVSEPGEDLRNAIREHGRQAWHTAQSESGTAYTDGQGNYATEELFAEA